jgi:hypothetical protein
MSVIPVDKKMKLNIVVPQDGIRIVLVTTNSKIQVIDNIFKTEKIYIYNGMILKKSMNLLYYNIKHDDCIIAYDKILVQEQNGKDSELNKWFRASKNPERMNHCVFKAIDGTIRAEISRIYDVKQNKLEMKRPLRRILNMQPYEGKVQADLPTIIPGKTRSPIQDPLPAFW